MYRPTAPEDYRIKPRTLGRTRDRRQDKHSRSQSRRIQQKEGPGQAKGRASNSSKERGPRAKVQGRLRRKSTKKRNPTRAGIDKPKQETETSGTTRREAQSIKTSKQQKESKHRITDRIRKETKNVQGGQLCVWSYSPARTKDDRPNLQNGSDRIDDSTM